MLRVPGPRKPKIALAMTLNRPLVGLARRIEAMLVMMIGIPMGANMSTKRRRRNGKSVRSKNHANAMASPMARITVPTTNHAVFSRSR